MSSLPAPPTPPARAHSPDPADTAMAAQLAFGPFVLDGPGGRLLRDGVPVELPPKPFAVLAWLAARPGMLVSKDALLDAVWGHRFVSDSVLKVAVNTLRGSLGEDARAPRWIETVSRRGYRFSADVRALDPDRRDAPQARPPPLGNLPAMSTGLVGREADLQRLQQALAEQRLVTLAGPGGVGKTRLALAAMGSSPPPDGVWLLRLDGLSSAEQVPPALARALGLGADAGRSAQTLARALAPLRLRVLLDNAEHLADALAPLLALWLQQAPEVQWLLTSQRTLRISGEQVQPLAPLALPRPQASPQEVAASPAVALFLQRVQAAQPAWQPDAAALDDAGAISAALDGLPLALELAAARVPLLGTAGVRQRLGERMKLLTRGAADAPDRHRTLRAALNWSVGLLPEPAAGLLRRLSVFAGSFSVPAVQAVSADDPYEVLDDLELLREMSLVVVAESAAGEPRLRLFDSVRHHAAEALAANGDEAAARNAHLAWVLSIFTAADERVVGCSELVWMAPLEPEAENLLAAMGHALGRAESATASDAADLAAAVQLFAASTGFCIRAGLKHTAKGWHTRLQPHLQTDRGTSLPEAVLARWHLATAVLGSLGQQLPPAEALAASEAAWPLLLSQGERRRALYLGFHRAQLHVRLRQPALATQAVAQMRALVDETSTLYERRVLDWVEATLARDRGDVAAYGTFWTDMLAQSRALGDVVEGWRAAWGLSQTLYLQGRLETAIELLDRTVDELRAAGRLRANAPIAGQAMMLRLARDATPETLRRLRETVQLLQSDGMLWWLADALAWVPLWHGRLEDAQRVQAWADGLVAQRGETRGPVFAKLRADFDAQLARQVSATAAGAAPHPPATELEALALALGDVGMA
ncbi:ATP-binding protein [Piscinibacter sp.]|uniref:ATP-binding protein n=1 Tax=Piscinibacter sp. TaxID=1903157 RepID=UPI002C067C50|nr:winged helix-turn-helix domain-containing protein [Albitalea sp.]HUG22345.1 winged helix-turn-helix domain-containing protein [Albitalea sp.]